LSLLLVDVDRLKRINDTHGHEAGDAALLLVAEAMRACSRETDTVARFGGDEFAWLAPFANASEAVELASRIRGELDSRRRPAGIDDVVTVSVGVTDLTAVTQRTPSELYRAADYALYEAKRRGRNCVVNSDELAPLSS
jgi:diguanylate cyclase (GGDEF)-like protein